MALYIPHSIFHLARLLYVRPKTFGPYYVRTNNNTVKKFQISKEVLSLQEFLLVQQQNSDLIQLESRNFELSSEFSIKYLNNL